MSGRDILDYVLVAAFAGWIMWTLYSGEISFARQGRSWTYTRHGTPIAFTVVVTVLVFLMIGFTIMLWQERARRAEIAARASARKARGDTASERSRNVRSRLTPFATQRDSALHLHNAGHYADAVKLYTVVLDNLPDDADLLHWRGIARWKLSENDSALADFRRAIALSPDRYDSYYTMDLILSERQQWDSILPLWNQFIARNPTNAEAYYARGGTHFRKGDRASAVTDSERACQLGDSLGCQVAARLKARTNP